MPRNEAVYVRVTEATKEEWAEHAEDPGTRWDDVSDMVRGSVRYELNGTHVRQEIQDALEDHGVELDQRELVDAVDIALSDTTENLHRVEDNLANLNEQLSTNEATTELAQEFHADWLIALPEGMTPVEIDIDPDVHEIMTEESLARIAGSTPAYSELMGHEEHVVRRALRRAQKLYPRVKSVVDPETTRKRYYVEDPDMDEPHTKDECVHMVGELIEEHGGFQSGLDIKKDQWGAK
jgi:hypothetical protein